MLNKTHSVEQNTIQGDNIMKCIICGREFDPETENGTIVDEICDQCEETRDELTNGREEGES